MISIITQRCATSLSSLSENQLKLLTQRTTGILYRDFHNIIMGVNDIETTDIVNSLNETHNNVIKSLKEEHKNELDEISNNYIDEIHSMTVKIEKIREDLRFKSDMRIKSLQDIHNEGLLQKENETLFYKTSYPHKGRCDIQPTESVFLSEKIYKPLACKHPFVVVGVDKTLEYLKQFGYKTFDKWIDESYDNEPDEDKRMSMIVEEVKRLTAISHEEWQAMIIEMIPTLQHNFDTLCRNKNLITANINLSQVFRNDGPY